MSRSLAETGPTLVSPVWAGDFLSRDHLVPGGAKVDAAQFYAPDTVVAVVGAAGAAQDAVAIPVAALSGPIPNGTILDFGAKKFAQLTAAAAAGDTSLTVEALATALVENDTARYAGVKPKSLPSGTVVGRTYAERAAGTNFGAAVSTDDEIFIVAFDSNDITVTGDVELVRHGTQVKENFLPGWTGLAAALQGKVREFYLTTVGV